MNVNSDGSWMQNRSDGSTINVHRDGSWNWSNATDHTYVNVSASGRYTTTGYKKAGKSTSSSPTAPSTPPTPNSSAKTPKTPVAAMEKSDTSS